MSVTILISIEYIKRESENPLRSIDWSHDDGVETWIKNYLKRNKIKSEIVIVDDEEYLNIFFKSDRQAMYFINIGNKYFPYFEFY